MKIQAALTDLDDYQPAMTDETLKGYANTRFRPLLEFAYRKSCRPYGIAGSIDDYILGALGATPAGLFLSGTPLLQALVDRDATKAAPLLANWNEERRQQGLGEVVVAEYLNSVVGGASTIIYIPNWPGKPNMEQWLQIQRTVGSMFFISLEPAADGYASFMRSSTLHTVGDTTTIDDDLGQSAGSCFSCHYSSKPLPMLPTDDPQEASKVAVFRRLIDRYPAVTNHPIYNPPASFPGIGTFGTLTLEKASRYAGRAVTSTELNTLTRLTACDSCHNGSYQNEIQPFAGMTTAILMKNGIMPPGQSGLPDAASIQLALSVLVGSYKETMTTFLLHTHQN